MNSFFKVYAMKEFEELINQIGCQGLGQVKIGQVRLRQVRLGYDSLGQASPGWVRLTLV